MGCASPFGSVGNYIYNLKTTMLNKWVLKANYTILTKEWSGFFLPGLSWNNRRGIIDNQLRQLCCRRWLSNKPEAVISRTNLAKSQDYCYYNVLGQLCRHVLSPYVKVIIEYSLTNLRSGTLNLSKLACYVSYIPACVVVAMQRHQIIYYDVTYSQ